jgi:hypothetical protein
MVDSIVSIARSVISRATSEGKWQTVGFLGVLQAFGTTPEQGRDTRSMRGGLSPGAGSCKVDARGDEEIACKTGRNSKSATVAAAREIPQCERCRIM